MIPSQFEHYRALFPLLDESIDWQLLRKWSLSEVYRLRLANDTTLIFKWGASDMARECDVYADLLSPLQVRSPRIYGSVREGEVGVMLMEDVGASNLEQNPEPAYYIEAARELARIRRNATASLGKNGIPIEGRRNYTIFSDYYYKQLIELSRDNGREHHRALQAAADWFPAALERLDREAPLTLIHHDYVPKNLVVHEGRVIPVDWSNAYLGRHLGDLYCLAREAQDTAKALAQDVRLAFADEMRSYPMPELEWQVGLGGICWHIQTLRWLLNGGVEAIPGSETWIPGLFDELIELLERAAVS